LGTPHRGSGLAPFAKVVANILKAGQKRVNKNILGLLTRGSEVLADVEDSFANWLRKKDATFNITSFYEELELPGVGQVMFPNYFLFIRNAVEMLVGHINCPRSSGKTQQS
jgi:hypothetical protein